MRIGILAGVVCLVPSLMFAGQTKGKTAEKSLLLEVVRKSWSVDRKESLVYLRVYIDGVAQAHPMRDVDFRDIRFREEQVSQAKLSALKGLISERATAQLASEYTSFWGNKDFGYEYDVSITSLGQRKLIRLVNFQPFLARKQGKPYPRQLEKLGCSIWRLRGEVSREALEKDWLQGCAGLGF